MWIMLFQILMLLLAFFLIVLILVQKGKGGGLAGALGGMGGQSAFGSKAGDTFTRITVVFAAVWIFVCAFAGFWFANTVPAGAIRGAAEEPAKAAAPKTPDTGTPGTTPEETPAPIPDSLSPAGASDADVEDILSRITVPETPPGESTTGETPTLDISELPEEPATTPAENPPVSDLPAEETAKPDQAEDALSEITVPENPPGNGVEETPAPNVSKFPGTPAEEEPAETTPAENPPVSDIPAAETENPAQ